LSKSGIKDIAARANVSPATVSRVISSPHLVSKKTLQKVQKVIDEAGYRPNRMGSSLRTRRSGNIVAIIPDITKPVNAGIIRAIEQVAQSNGYSILLGDTQGLEERERHYAELVEQGQADGILLFGARLPFDIDNSRPLKDQLPPIVNGNERIDSDQLVQVSVDNVAAAKMAVTHLTSLGHKRIAAVTGPMDVPSSSERLQGYRDALASAGLSFDPELVVQAGYDAITGMEAGRTLLQRKERPTAIFCFDDDTAIGVMKLYQQQGFMIPQDVSIMGFDDIHYAEFVTPALTTVHQPLEEIGKTCINLLLQQLAGKTVAPGRQFLPFELMIRGSTGPAPS
jgi:LacI family repressor for deo operon, udp, cdd, tsx, nupC, and nupG